MSCVVFDTVDLSDHVTLRTVPAQQNALTSVADEWIRGNPIISSVHSPRVLRRNPIAGSWQGNRAM
jgi:hypothetical protein